MNMKLTFSYMYHRQSQEFPDPSTGGEGDTLSPPFLPRRLDSRAFGARPHSFLLTNRTLPVALELLLFRNGTTYRKIYNTRSECRRLTCLLKFGIHKMTNTATSFTNSILW